MFISKGLKTRTYFFKIFSEYEYFRNILAMLHMKYYFENILKI